MLSYPNHVHSHTSTRKQMGRVSNNKDKILQKKKTMCIQMTNRERVYLEIILQYYTLDLSKNVIVFLLFFFWLFLLTFPFFHFVFCWAWVKDRLYVIFPLFFCFLMEMTIDERFTL